MSSAYERSTLPRWRASLALAIGAALACLAGSAIAAEVSADRRSPDTRRDGEGRQAAAACRAAADKPLGGHSGRNGRRLWRHAALADLRTRRLLLVPDDARLREPADLGPEGRERRAQSRRLDRSLAGCHLLHLQAPRGDEVVGRRAVHGPGHHVLVERPLHQRQGAAGRDLAGGDLQAPLHARGQQSAGRGA